MRDGEHSSPGEVLFDGLLYELVRRPVHVRRSLVQAHYLHISQERPRQAEKLSLSHRQAAPSFPNVSIETSHILEGGPQPASLYRPPEDGVVSDIPLRVEVAPPRAAEEEGILWDYHHLRPDVIDNR